MGGIEAHVTDLARGLIDRGWRVALICPDTDAVKPLREQTVRLGGTVHPVPEAHNPIGVVWRAFRLGWILRHYRDAVVHLHLQGETGGILILFAARVTRAAAVVRTLHNPPVPPISPLGRVQVAISNRFLDRVVCVSPETLRTQLREFRWSPQKMATIPNGVDLNRFSPMPTAAEVRRELGLAPGAPVVGTVARLQEARKGISEFIDMAAAVAPRRPDTSFVVVGDGPLRLALERQAEQLGLSSRFVFTGYRSDVPRLLSAMDVAIFPSSYEAAQYVMLEAMAMAVPIVITPAGLAIDLIQPEANGVLVPVHDTRAMADAVVRLLGDPSWARQLGQAGRDAVVRGYSSEAMVDSIAAMYRDVTDGRLPPAGIRASIDFRRSPEQRQN
jgi:glycosyltransferase involved in cell wall biosynthesis